MKKLVLATLVLGIALIGLQAQASANLLTDPGFDTQATGWLGWDSTPWWGGGGGDGETGSYGWTEIVDTQSQSSSQSTKFSSSDNTGWTYAMVAQTVSGIVAGSQYRAASYFKRTADIGSTVSSFKVEWLDGTGATIETSEGTAQFDNTYDVDTWQLVSENFTAVSGAVGAKYEIVYLTSAGSAIGDVFVDDANFDVVPEPTSLVLLCGGLMGLFTLTRKKNN